MSIEIINPGMFTTVQDLGRQGYQKYGIPPSGGIDPYSLQLANLLVGNDREEACLEATISPPTIKFNEDVWFAVTGADWQPELNGRELSLWKSFPAKTGDRLSFKSTEKGMRVYISVSGGISVDAVLGSKSTYTRAGFGGFQGRALESGDVLNISDSGQVFSQEIPENYRPELKLEDIGVVLGPQETHFNKKGIENFLNSKYTVATDADRMGVRLEGPPIEHRDGADIISEPVAGGSIQVPGNGQPIILLSDRQTTGGYTKVATAIKSDLHKLAQMRPGSEVSFRKIPLEKAYSLRKEQLKDLKEVENLLKGNKLISRDEFKIRIEEKSYSVNLELKSADSLKANVRDEYFSISFLESETENSVSETSEEAKPVSAPMPGEIISIQISDGEEVMEGDTLMTLEAMKMENTISAPFSGIVSHVDVSEGDEVKDGEILLTLKQK
mgnify:CR=1 FL=1